jgi:hypothetical protein
MKFIFYYVVLTVLLVGCKTETDNSVNETFETNSKTVLANLEGWENENLDYAMYADDFVMSETAFGAEKDSLSLKEVMANDKQTWARYDFKLLTKPPVLLPGVNPETRKPDGSVRHYSDWEVILPATDSTEARSGVIHLYESFDFNTEGKILFQQVYGDFSGIMMYLNRGGQ